MSANTQPSSIQKPLLAELLNAVEQIIVGKPLQVRMALTCFLAGGHLLIEDLPGMGKTTLAHALSKVLGLSFNRIQFTSDMLPADVIGSMIFEQSTGTFAFHPGPIFTDFLLADEINRATPRTQSALLEAMEEQQVTIEGHAKPLPSPFFVIATQNPAYQIGTFELPESQLDRFLMRIELGYPDETAEKLLLNGQDRRTLIAKLNHLVTKDQIHTLMKDQGQIHVSDTVIEYVQRLLKATRDDQQLIAGLSPRAGLGLLSAARAWVFIDGRDHVLPEDVKRIWPYVAAHRLTRKDSMTSISADSANEYLNHVNVPL